MPFASRARICLTMLSFLPAIAWADSVVCEPGEAAPEVRTEGIERIDERLSEFEPRFTMILRFPATQSGLPFLGASAVLGQDPDEPGLAIGLATEQLPDGDFESALVVYRSDQRFKIVARYGLVCK